MMEMQDVIVESGSGLGFPTLATSWGFKMSGRGVTEKNSSRRPLACQENVLLRGLMMALRS